jgi:DNA ligase (NAD+)
MSVRLLEDGQIHFVPYNQLRSWTGPADVLLKEIEAIIRNLKVDTIYPMDGVVVEVTDPRLQSHLGATAHHYRWQIAVKRKGESAETVVQAIQWQVGRAGNITPVMNVAPVSLSGATIRRVTAHHAGMVDRLRIGPGALIEIIRSGEVIPKLERVIEAAEVPCLPQFCPSCGQSLTFRGDFLRCTNSNCTAQIEQRISHWFRTMGNADWFGIKTIQKLVACGYDTLEKIFRHAGGRLQRPGVWGRCNRATCSKPCRSADQNWLRIGDSWPPWVSRIWESVTAGDCCSIFLWKR